MGEGKRVLFMDLAKAFINWVYPFTGLNRNTGLDYWTDMFLVFTHVVVGLIESHWLRVFRICDKCRI